MTIHNEPIPGVAWPIRATPHTNDHAPTQHAEVPAAAPPDAHEFSTRGPDADAVYGRVVPDAAEATAAAPGPAAKKSFADQLGNAFYVAAAGTAVVGQAWAAAKAVPFPEHTAEALKVAAVTPGVVVAELGGMASAALADARQRIGEKAYGYRALSAGAAAGAIALQVGGHADQPVLAGAFAGISGFGYGLYLLRSAAQRRDALRAAGKLTDTAPTYGVRQWVKEPGITRRAKALAVEQGLSVSASLAAAREEKLVAERRAAIGSVIKEVMEAEHGDSLRAKIATTTYDLDKLAARIEARTDYDGWADTISGALTPPRTDQASTAGEPLRVQRESAELPDEISPRGLQEIFTDDSYWGYEAERADRDAWAAALAEEGEADGAAVSADRPTAESAAEPEWTVENATKAAHLMLAANDVEALSQLYSRAAADDPVARAALADADVWETLGDDDRAAMVGLAVKAAAADDGQRDEHHAATDLKESATDLKNSEAGSAADSLTEAAALRGFEAAALRRERAAALASRIREQEGYLPTGSQLAQAARVAKSTANYAMKPMRVDSGVDAVVAAGRAVADLHTSAGHARERRSSDTDQESAAGAYQHQQALWQATDQHEHTAGDAMEA